MDNKDKNKERSFIMVKPDGVQRGLIGDIMKRFEQKGFKLVAMKFLKVILEAQHVINVVGKKCACALVSYAVTECGM